MPSVKFGGPFEGYCSSVLKHLVPPSKTPGSPTTGSTNAQLNPFDGSWHRRSGSTIVGDTVTGATATEVGGLLEQKFSARCRKLGELDSLSFSDGYPAPSALLTNETNAATFPTADTGWFGQMYVQDIADSANYSFLSEFGSTHYPSAGGAGALDYKVVPLWYESGEGGYTRGATPFTRRFTCPGSRSWLDVGDWRYLPNLRGTPFRWNKRFNYGVNAGTEPNRIAPTGPFGPMHPATLATGTASAGSDAAWDDGDTFYHSVMFQFEDGSYSLPFVPRPKNARLANGLGFFTVGTVAGGNKYKNVAWTNIPIGPEGTIARILLRSPKQKLAATTDVLTISYGNLQICGVLRNNTQTSFTDTLGADAGLLLDDNIVRYDWVCPRRSRTIGMGDQRVIVGYSLPSPCAIMLAPSGSASSRDLNLPDTGAIVGATNFLARITSTQVELLKIATAGTPTTGGGGNMLPFDYATYATLQDLVDAINATTTAAVCGEWCAALAPGVDGSLQSSSLCQSVISVGTCSASGTALTTASDTSVPLGYEIYDSAGKYPFGTYVASRIGATGLVTSAAATGAVNATLLFYANTGDNNLAAGYVGYLRAFAPSMPIMLYLRRSKQVGYDKIDKRSIYFTVSSPGAAQVGISLAANAWASANRRQPEGISGSLMAVTGIEDAAVLEYSRSRHMFVNRRGVTSGEDFDYRVVPINLRRGAIHSSSCTAVNNVAVCLTRQGIVAVDKSMREAVISNDIHNPGTGGLSSLLSEITQCLAGAQGDSDTGFFPIAQLGTQLHACYRSAGSGTTPNRRFIYDYSAGAEASGLDGLLKTNQSQSNIAVNSPYAVYTGNAFGWSAPFSKGYSAMCEVTRGAGPVRYGWSDSNVGANGDGRLDVIDDATAGGLDNGVTFVATVYTPQLMPPEFSLIVAKRGQFVVSFSSDSGITLYRTRAHSGSSSLNIPATTGDYGRPILEYPQAARANGQCYEALIALANENDVLWSHTLEYELADQYLTS